jgi:hypothetical protein
MPLCGQAYTGFGGHVSLNLMERKQRDEGAEEIQPGDEGRGRKDGPRAGANA